MYVTKIARLASFGSKNPWKSVSFCIRPWMWWLTAGSLQVERYSCFFAHTCVPPQGRGGPGVHTRAHWLVGVLLCLPQCWLDETPDTNCSVLLAAAVCWWCLQCSKYFTDMQCSARTGYVFCGTLVFFELCGWFPLLSYIPLCSPVKSHAV